MIKFFRKIRQKLLSENKVSKYLLYAIGEIILVVIGILIALQINNWNENRKDKQLEENLLIQLSEDIKTNIAELERSHKSNKGRNYSSNMVIKALKQDLPFNDSISKHFEQTHGMGFLGLDHPTFDVIKSKGLGIISNDSLRKKIQATFKTYEVIQKFQDRVNTESDNTLNKYQQELQIIIEAPYKGGNNQPLDYEELKSNFKYINTLQDNSNNLYAMALYTEKILKWNQDLLKLINEELNIEK